MRFIILTYTGSQTRVLVDAGTIVHVDEAVGPQGGNARVYCKGKTPFYVLESLDTIHRQLTETDQPHDQPG